MGAPQHALVMGNQTRRSSTHDMAERATEQRGASLTAHSMDEYRNPAESSGVSQSDTKLTMEDFSNLVQREATYEPFQRLTTKLQAEGATAPLVVPSYFHLI